MNQANSDSSSSSQKKVRPVSVSGAPLPVSRKPGRGGRRRPLLLIWLVALLILTTVSVAAFKHAGSLTSAINQWLPGRLGPSVTTGSGKSPGGASGGGAASRTTGSAAHPTGTAFKAGKLVVVLDPGHGGSDPGALATDPDGKTIQETQVTLALSKRLASRLEQLGVEVVMTRETDTWVSLYRRIAETSLLSLDCLAARKPNLLPSASRLNTLREALQIPIDINSDNKASGGLGFMAGYGVGDLQKNLMDLQKSCDQLLFVSIHGNSSTNRNLHGTQVYYCDDEIVAREEAEQLAAQTSPAGNRAYANRDDERNRQLATHVYQAIIDAIPALADTNAGKTVLSGNYAVLREQALASILVETGYMSHTGDLSILLDETSQKKLADAIAQGIHDYAKARRIIA